MIHTGIHPCNVSKVPLPPNTSLVGETDFPHPGCPNAWYGQKFSKKTFYHWNNIRTTDLPKDAIVSLTTHCAVGTPLAQAKRVWEEGRRRTRTRREQPESRLTHSDMSPPPESHVSQVLFKEPNRTDETGSTKGYLCVLRRTTDSSTIGENYSGRFRNHWSHPVLRYGPVRNGFSWDWGYCTTESSTIGENYSGKFRNHWAVSHGGFKIIWRRLVVLSLHYRYHNRVHCYLL